VGQQAGDAAQPGHVVGAADGVPDVETARPQYAANFAEKGLWVFDMLHHRNADDEVEPFVRKRNAAVWPKFAEERWANEIRVSIEVGAPDLAVRVPMRRKHAVVAAAKVQDATAHGQAHQDLVLQSIHVMNVIRKISSQHRIHGATPRCERSHDVSCGCAAN